jgi:hypothetical protein
MNIPAPDSGLGLPGAPALEAIEIAVERLTDMTAVKPDSEYQDTGRPLVLAYYVCGRCEIRGGDFEESFRLVNCWSCGQRAHIISLDYTRRKCDTQTQEES